MWMADYRALMAAAATYNVNRGEHTPPISATELMLRRAGSPLDGSDLLAKVVAINRLFGGSDLREDN